MGAQTETKTRPATDRQMAAALLMESGLPDATVAKTLGYSESGMRVLRNRLKSKGIGDFVTAKRLKAAKRVVDTFLEGRAIGETVDEDGKLVDPGVRPKDSTVMAAAAMVLDRAFPKQQDTGPQVQNSFTTVNLNFASFPTAPERDPQTIDISPSITSGNALETGG